MWDQFTAQIQGMLQKNQQLTQQIEVRIKSLQIFALQTLLSINSGKSDQYPRNAIYVVFKLEWLRCNLIGQYKSFVHLSLYYQDLINNELRFKISNLQNIGGFIFKCLLQIAIIQQYEFKGNTRMEFAQACQEQQALIQLIHSCIIVPQWKKQEFPRKEKISKRKKKSSKRGNQIQLNQDNDGVIVLSDNDQQQQQKQFPQKSQLQVQTGINPMDKINLAFDPDKQAPQQNQKDFNADDNDNDQLKSLSQKTMQEIVETLLMNYLNCAFGTKLSVEQQITIDAKYIQFLDLNLIQIEILMRLFRRGDSSRTLEVGAFSTSGKFYKIIEYLGQKFFQLLPQNLAKNKKWPQNFSYFELRGQKKKPTNENNQNNMSFIFIKECLAHCTAMKEYGIFLIALLLYQQTPKQGQQLQKLDNILILLNFDIIFNPNSIDTWILHIETEIRKKEELVNRRQLNLQNNKINNIMLKLSKIVSVLLNILNHKSNNCLTLNASCLQFAKGLKLRRCIETSLIQKLEKCFRLHIFCYLFNHLIEKTLKISAQQNNEQKIKSPLKADELTATQPENINFSKSRKAWRSIAKRVAICKKLQILKLNLSLYSQDKIELFQKFFKQTVSMKEMRQDCVDKGELTNFDVVFDPFLLYLEYKCLKKLNYSPNQCMFALHRVIKTVEKSQKWKNIIIEHDLKSLYIYKMFKINAGKIPNLNSNQQMSLMKEREKINLIDCFDITQNSLKEFCQGDFASLYKNEAQVLQLIQDFKYFNDRGKNTQFSNFHFIRSKIYNYYGEKQKAFQQIALLRDRIPSKFYIEFSDQILYQTLL